MYILCDAVQVLGMLGIVLGLLLMLVTTSPGGDS